jgi:hypothetical protein
MSTTTATTTDTTTYSITSALSRVIANHPATTTLGYTNDLELDTVNQASSPGFGTRLFLANLTSSTLSTMGQVAMSALAVGGQVTIQYQVVPSGSSPVAVIISLSYNGKTINA